MGGSLLVEVEQGVGVVTLNRPERRNALDRPLLTTLASALTELDVDERVHAIVLTGSDPAFCSGVDLKAAAEGIVARPQDGLPLPVISKPLVAAVNGPAVTGGLELVLACDFAIASERAAFADTHVHLGTLPFWGLTAFLPAAVGVRRARQMSLTGTQVDAQTALTWGLVNEVVPHEKLLPRAVEICGEIGGANTDASRAILAVYRNVAGETLNVGWEQLVAGVWHGRVLDAEHWRRASPTGDVPPRS